VTWLQQKAAYHITSMTAEIIRVVRRRMAEERRSAKAEAD
jgi:hypothetical protein